MGRNAHKWKSLSEKPLWDTKYKVYFDALGAKISSGTWKSVMLNHVCILLRHLKGITTLKVLTCWADGTGIFFGGGLPKDPKGPKWPDPRSIVCGILEAGRSRWVCWYIVRIIRLQSDPSWESWRLVTAWKCLWRIVTIWIRSNLHWTPWRVTACDGLWVFVTTLFWSQ